jgi:hypothetical protein
MSGFRVKILLASIPTGLVKAGASVLVIEPDDVQRHWVSQLPGNRG